MARRRVGLGARRNGCEGGASVYPWPVPESGQRGGLRWEVVRRIGNLFEVLARGNDFVRLEKSARESRCMPWNVGVTIYVQRCRTFRRRRTRA